MIYRNIIEAEEVLPLKFQEFSGLDSRAKTCIQGILQSNANIRLGMMHDGLQDLWEAPFFDGKKEEKELCFSLNCYTDNPLGITVEQILKKQLPAPYM